MATRFAPMFDLDLMTRPWSAPLTSASAPMDAVRHPDSVELRFDLPGVTPEAVELSVERNVLTLTAERNWVLDDEDRVLVRERRHGSLKRQLRLPESLDTGRVEASFDHGVLSVRIPVAETAQPKKVSISVGSGEVAEAAAIGEGSDN